MKNKVTGTKMVKFLKLDNFTKYEEQFLLPGKRKKAKNQ